jgi:hypothetical protein
MDQVKIVKLADIDVSLITFGEIEKTKHNGFKIKILYNNSPVMVSCGERYYVPFGIQELRTKENEFYGYSLSVSSSNESSTEMNKFRELDLKILDFLVSHAASMNLDAGQLCGEDDRGYNGKYKRFVRYSYKKGEGEEEKIQYLNYPPRTEVRLQNDKRDILLEAYSNQKKMICSGTVPCAQARSILCKGSSVSPIIFLSHIAVGDFGAIVVNGLKYIVIHETLKFPSIDECLLQFDEAN